MLQTGWVRAVSQEGSLLLTWEQVLFGPFKNWNVKKAPKHRVGEYAPWADSLRTRTQMSSHEADQRKGLATWGKCRRKGRCVVLTLGRGQAVPEPMLAGLTHPGHLGLLTFKLKGFPAAGAVQHLYYSKRTTIPSLSQARICGASREPAAWRHLPPGQWAPCGTQRVGDLNKVS